jgi:hypothetical protein
MVMIKRDRILLLKIRNYQGLLANTVKELNITSPNDLNKIHVIMRRGLVQTVGDIFELTILISPDVQKSIPLNREVIKQFRNTASHNYSQITSEMAYACIIHCIDKKIVDSITNLLKE